MRYGEVVSAILISGMDIRALNPVTIVRLCEKIDGMTLRNLTMKHCEQKAQINV